MLAEYPHCRDPLRLPIGFLHFKIMFARLRCPFLACALMLASLAAGARAAPDDAGDHISHLDPVSVQGGNASMVGNAESANAGIVTRE